MLFKRVTAMFRYQELFTVEGSSTVFLNKTEFDIVMVLSPVLILRY